MNQDQLKPIIENLNKHLVEELQKIEPGIKNSLWAKHPSFKGIQFLLKKILPILSNIGIGELDKLLDLSNSALHHLRIHMSDQILATCFVFVDHVTVDGKLISFDDDEIMDFFEDNTRQVQLNAVYGKSSPFYYPMIDQKVHGFTKHTYEKFTSRKGHDDSILISRQVCNNFNDPILIPELENEISYNRDEILEALKNEWGNKFLRDKCAEIEKRFHEFSLNVKFGYDNLLETLESIIEVLTQQIKLKKQEDQIPYLHLNFDERENQKIIQYLYDNLNNKAFETSRKNFTSVFSRNPTIPIKWKLGLNAFLKLFLGFENLVIDGIAKNYEGILLQRKDLYVAISECFEFNFNSTIPNHNYISGKYRALRYRKPREMAFLLPIIDLIKESGVK
jgi:hypothetical protein